MEAFAEHVCRSAPASRLSEALGRVRLAFPTARVEDIEGEETGFPGARVVMPNGMDVVVGVDLDRPADLFEVVRLYAPGERAKYDFELTSANGFASTDKLTDGALLKVLGWYAEADIGLMAAGT